jgi:xylose isomerase
MFADPLSVTVNAVAINHYRTGNSLTSSKYQNTDGSSVFSINQSSGRRNQHRARKDNSKIIVDPLASDRNVPVSMSCFVQVDVPPTGYTLAEMKYELIALADWIKAGTNADKLLGNEI